MEKYNLLSAHPLPLPFRHHTVKESLSHNFVTETLQDSQCLIWITTVDGLNKYDGYTYTVYHTDPDNSSSLSSSNIINLAEDKNGNLWIGGLGGGVNYFDAETEQFTHFKHQPNEPRALAIVK